MLKVFKKAIVVLLLILVVVEVNHLEGLTKIKVPDFKLSTSNLQLFKNSLPSFSSLFSTVATADEPTSGVCGENAKWSYDASTLTLTISGYGDMDNYGTWWLPWHNYKPQIKNIIISNSITSIAGYAFQDCENVESINIPNSITTIGDHAFCRCTGLKELIIPNGVREIYWAAFSGCAGLTKITLPASLTYVGDYAFSVGELESLTLIYTGTISQWCSICFSHYTANPIQYTNRFLVNGKLVSTIKENDLKGIERIGAYAFYNYSPLSTVIMPNNIRGVDSSAFMNCSGLSSVTISNTIEYISDNAFNGCSGLTNPDIPNSVTWIDDWAFCGCTSFTKVIIPESVTHLGMGVFANCSYLTEANIPDSINEVPSHLFYYCTNLDSICLPDNITYINDSAFEHCIGLTNVIIPQRVEVIGQKAFMGCVGLENIIIPGNVTTIYDNAFSHCTGAEKLTVSPGVEYICKEAFEKCTGLSSVTIPGTVITIGDRAFRDCTGLASVEILNGVETIEPYAFVGCINITDMEFPHSITEIGAHAFDGCTGLESVVIPNSVKSLGDRAFTGCTNLKNISLSDSLTMIGAYPFHNTGFYSDESNWDNGVLYVGKYLTETNGNISNDYEVKPGTILISPQSFANCTDLSTLILPKSVIYIGRGAFSDCKALTDVYYSGSVNDRDLITLESYLNEYLLDAVWHYASLRSSDAAELWDPESFFTSSTYKYNPELAYVCAVGCEQAETKNKIEAHYKSLGFSEDEIETNHYGFNDYGCYGIAVKEYNDFNLMMITVRGTKTWREGLADYTTKADKEFYGYSAYGAVKEIHDFVIETVNAVISKHNFLISNGKMTKVLITGHSLGGATANLLGANFNNLARNYGGHNGLTFSVNDVYCYTFGAIDSIGNAFYNSDSMVLPLPVESGYRNIHNVYNFYDTFGPAWAGLSLENGIGTGIKKFGVFHCFSDKRTGDRTDATDLSNPTDAHNEPTYINAVYNLNVDEKGTDYICKGKGDKGYSIFKAQWPTNVFVMDNDSPVCLVKNNISTITVPGSFTDVQVNDCVVEFNNTNIELVAAGENTVFVVPEEYDYYFVMRLNQIFKNKNDYTTSYWLIKSTSQDSGAASYLGVSNQMLGKTYQTDKLSVDIKDFKIYQIDPNNPPEPDEPDNPNPTPTDVPKASIIKGNPSDGKKTYDYRSNVTFTANVPDGGSVQWYIDGEPAGSDKTLTVEDRKSSYKVTIVVTDKDGNQTMDEEQVTIKNGFFDKIVWFFKHLFNPGACNVVQ